MNKCEKCGFLHYRTDPCRNPKESTAARKDVREPKGSPSKSLQVGSALAGTQVQSVDTNPAGPRGLGAGHISPARGTGKNARVKQEQRRSPEQPVEATSAGMVGHVDRQPKFDRKAWMRQHMPAYMRKYRAEVKAGTRVPKPKETKE